MYRSSVGCANNIMASPPVPYLCFLCYLLFKFFLANFGEILRPLSAQCCQTMLAGIPDVSRLDMGLTEKVFPAVYHVDIPFCKPRGVEVQERASPQYSDRFPASPRRPN